MMRKRLSSGQKWSYFPLIKGMFVFRSGLSFSFRTESDIWKKPLSWADFYLLESNSIYMFSKVTSIMSTTQDFAIESTGRQWSDSDPIKT